MEIKHLIQVSQYKWKNAAGFTFDFEHLMREGYYYRQEQQVIVSGIDGSYRWRLASKYTYLGMFAIVYYGYLKLIMDKFPALRKLHESNLIFRLFVDVIATYFVAMVPISFTD